ncbi:hypothetical protein AHAS_Ahas06G0199700 [Arachis hypogaea]
MANFSPNSINHGIVEYDCTCSHTFCFKEIVKPDEDTVRRVANAFRKLGQEEKSKLVTKRYRLKWKYIHFVGERVKVRIEAWEEEGPFRS